MATHRFFIVLGVMVAVIALAYFAAQEALTPDSYSTEPLQADMNELTAEELPGSVTVEISEGTAAR